MVEPGLRAPRRADIPYSRVESGMVWAARDQTSLASRRRARPMLEARRESLRPASRARSARRRPVAVRASPAAVAAITPAAAAEAIATLEAVDIPRLPLRPARMLLLPPAVLLTLPSRRTRAVIEPARLPRVRRARAEVVVERDLVERRRLPPRPAVARDRRVLVAMLHLFLLVGDLVVPLTSLQHHTVFGWASRVRTSQ